MLKTVHVGLCDTFADWELGYATAHVQRTSWQAEPGTWRVQYVGATRAAVTSMGGMRVRPDLTLAELHPADSAMLVLPGSDIWPTDAFRPFVDKARAFLAAGTPVAAICGATGALAAAGLLDDRPHTSNAREFLASTGYAGGDRYVERPAVIDGDLITASGTRPVDFACAIFERLGVYAPDVRESWRKLYGDNDPAGFYELMAVS